MNLKGTKEAIEFAGEFANILLGVDIRRHMRGGGDVDAKGGQRFPSKEAAAEQRRHRLGQAMNYVEIHKSDSGDDDPFKDLRADHEINVSALWEFLKEQEKRTSPWVPEKAEFGLAYPISDSMGDSEEDIKNLAIDIIKLNKAARENPEYLDQMTRLANDRKAINEVLSAVAKLWAQGEKFFDEHPEIEETVAKILGNAGKDAERNYQSIILQIDEADIIDRWLVSFVSRSTARSFRVGIGSMALSEAIETLELMIALPNDQKRTEMAFARGLLKRNAFADGLHSRAEKMRKKTKDLKKKAERERRKKSKKDKKGKS